MAGFTREDYLQMFSTHEGDTPVPPTEEELQRVRDVNAELSTRTAMTEQRKADNQLPREGEQDYNPVESFFGSLANSMLWGAGSSSEVSENPEALDSMSRQNPKSSLAGTMIGSIPTGGLIMKGVKALFGTTSRGIAAVNMLDNPVGRVAASGTFGATEDGVRAAFAGGDISEAMTMGALGGMGGQLFLGEMLAGLGNKTGGRITGRTQAQGDNELALALKVANPMYADSPEELTAILTAIRKRLGEDATIADVSDALRDYGVRLVAADQGHMTEFTSMMQRRVVDNPTRVRDMLDTLDSPNSPTSAFEMSQAGVERRAELSTDLTAILGRANDAGVSYDSDVLFDMISHHSGATNLALINDPSVNSALAPIAELLMKNVRTVDGDLAYTLKNGEWAALDPDAALRPISPQLLLKLRDRVTDGITDASPSSTVQLSSADAAGRRSLSDLRTQLTGMLRDSVDDFGANMDGYTNSHHVQQAFDLGANAISARTGPLRSANGQVNKSAVLDSASLTATIDNYMAAELPVEPLITGMKVRLTELINEAAQEGSSDAVSAILNPTGRIGTMLSSVLDEPTAEALLNSAYTSYRFTAAENAISRVTGKSGPRREAGTRDMLDSLLIAGGAGGVLSQNMAAGAAVRQASSFGAGSRIDKHIANAMSQKGAMADNVLRGITGGERAIPFDAADLIGTTGGASGAAGMLEYLERERAAQE